MTIFFLLVCSSCNANGEGIREGDDCVQNFDKILFKDQCSLYLETAILVAT